MGKYSPEPVAPPTSQLFTRKPEVELFYSTENQFGSLS